MGTKWYSHVLTDTPKDQTTRQTQSFRILIKGSCTAPGHLMREGSLSGPSAVHTRQSDMHDPSPEVCLLVPEIKFWTDRVVNLSTMRLMFFYFVKKKAQWILPHRKKVW